MMQFHSFQGSPLEKVFYRREDLRLEAYQDRHGSFFFTADQLTAPVGRAASSLKPIVGETIERAFYTEPQALDYWRRQCQKGNVKAIVLLHLLGEALPPKVLLPSDSSELIFRHRETGFLLSGYRLFARPLIFLSSRQICQPLDLHSSLFHRWLKTFYTTQGAYAFVSQPNYAKPLKVFNASILMAFWADVLQQRCSIGSENASLLGHLNQVTGAMHVYGEIGGAAVAEVLRTESMLYPAFAQERVFIYPLEQPPALSVVDCLCADDQNQLVQEENSDPSPPLFPLIIWLCSHVAALNQQLHAINEQVRHEEATTAFWQRASLVAYASPHDSLESLLAEMQQLATLVTAEHWQYLPLSPSLALLVEQLPIRALEWANEICERKKIRLKLLINERGKLYLKGRLPKTQNQSTETVIARSTTVSLKRKLSIPTVAEAIELLIDVDLQIQAKTFSWSAFADRIRASSAK